MNTSEPENIYEEEVNTEGGSYVKGDVRITQGDFVGRDKIINIGPLPIPQKFIKLIVVLLVLVIGLSIYISYEANYRFGNTAMQLDEIGEVILATSTLTPTPTSTPTPTPIRMADGQFNVAVAKFTVIGSETEIPAHAEAYDLSASIAKFIQTQAESLTQVIGEQVVVWGPDEGIPFVFPNEEATLALSLNADVLIYGQLHLDTTDKWQVEPRFYLATEVVNQAAELYGEHALGNLIAYRPNNQAAKRDVNMSLQIRVEALSQLLLGLAYMAFGERNGYQKASETFLSTLNTSVWGSSLDGTGQEILHLFLGNSLLRLAYLTEDELPEKLQLLNRSQAAFEEALKLNPNYARGYNGLAAALFQIARPPVHEDACEWDWDLLYRAEANFQKATALPSDLKPSSGYVDYYAYFGLGRVDFWNGYCQDKEKWSEAVHYYQKALAEYAKITDPIINLTDVAAYINTDLGFMSLLEAESLLELEDAESQKSAANGLAQSITYYTKVFQLAQTSNSDEVRQHVLETMPYYLTALCLDHQGPKALDDLANFAQGFPEPNKVKTHIIELTNQDLWGECHAQAN